MIFFIAPCPLIFDSKDGYLIRISAIDNLFINEKRCYLHVDTTLNTLLPKKTKVNGLVTYFLFNPKKILHVATILLKVLFSVKKVFYFHSVYNTKKLFYLFYLGKCFIDLHGLAYEEMRMMNNIPMATYLQKCEQYGIDKATRLIAVTNTMKNYFVKAYKADPEKFIVLPIFEFTDKPLSKTKLHKTPTVIYSGSAAVWQNVDHLLDVISKTVKKYDHTIYSMDTDIFTTKLKELNILDKVILKKGPKEEVIKSYNNQDFGLVLRVPDIVNTVSCPTKLIEYMTFGVIPVVQDEKMGDFIELGYKYIKEDNFVKGSTISNAEFVKIINFNKDIIKKLKQKAITASNTLVKHVLE